MFSAKKLHDATLTRIEVDWASGELRCTCNVQVEGRKTVLILAEGLKMLKCPRLYPWGTSVSVNEIRTEKGENGTLLSIEMQSGDTIEVTAERISIE